MKIMVQKSLKRVAFFFLTVIGKKKIYSKLKRKDVNNVTKGSQNHEKIRARPTDIEVHRGMARK